MFQVLRFLYFTFLMQCDWLVPSMRVQVIQDSLFSRLGSGPFSGRGKRESRNRTKRFQNQTVKKIQRASGRLMNPNKMLEGENKNES